jgi:hypothetical protein
MKDLQENKGAMAQSWSLPAIVRIHKNKELAFQNMEE